jgi:hypothetical protein
MAALPLGANINGCEQSQQNRRALGFSVGGAERRFVAQVNDQGLSHWQSDAVGLV